MPELPEVETIKSGLDLFIVGHKFKEVKVLSEKTFPYAKEVTKTFVVGSRIKSVERRAKILIINLDSEYSLLFHLKMTGQIIYDQKAGERFAGGHPTESMIHKLPDNSTRVIFIYDNGDKLYFNDQRKFGWIKLEPTSEVKNDSLIKRLGPEPLSEHFTLPGFKSVLKRRGRTPIKAVILDQSTVSGIGNIYADESLHLAKIHPATIAANLTDSEIKRLHRAIKEIIKRGIEYGGTSFTHYVNALGKTGDYLKHARVFRQTGRKCSVCGTEIVKTRVAGRGTHLCPKCQKLKP